MLFTNNLDQLEQERAEMWELFALLMDLPIDFKFTAKELSKELDYSKSDLNKLLFRLSLEKALIMYQKPKNLPTLYSLNPDFLPPA